MVPGPDLDRFREKLARELKSGVVGMALLLAISRTGPDYGYRLLRTAHEASGGGLDLKEGTAYPQLQNLERAGLVTSFWGDGDQGPPRKYYQATPLGKEAAERAVEEWRRLSDGVEKLVEDLGRKKKQRHRRRLSPAPAAAAHARRR